MVLRIIVNFGVFVAAFNPGHYSETGDMIKHWRAWCANRLKHRPCTRYIRKLHKGKQVYQIQECALKMFFYLLAILFTKIYNTLLYLHYLQHSTIIHFVFLLHKQNEKKRKNYILHLYFRYFTILHIT